MSVTSPCHIVVDYINYKLSAPEATERNSILQSAAHGLMTAGRVITRASLDALATPFTLVETAFFGALQAITFLPSYTNYECTTNAYASAKEHTFTALDATKNALLGIFGYGEVVEQVVVEDNEYVSIEEEDSSSSSIENQQ